jgi:hypothetical protein
MIQTASPAGTVAAFRMTGHDVQRHDLAARKEIKFTFPHADVGKLRRLLDANCQRLIYHQPVSTVRSIYFDDALLSACRANLDGLGRRHKLRVRWYDTPRPAALFFLEIKWRNKRVTGKHRWQLESDQALDQLSYRQIVRGLHAVIPSDLLGQVFTYSEPIVLVQYRREHFASEDGKIRVTLDYDLTYYDQVGKSGISTSFPRRRERLIVIEGKTPIGREAELQRLFYPLRARMGRCSKYVDGCRLLGLVHDPTRV